MYVYIYMSIYLNVWSFEESPIRTNYLGVLSIKSGIFMYIYVFNYMYMCIHMYIYVYVNTYVYICIHICVIYMHIYTYICIRRIYGPII
jgi:hypothetical protein